MYWSLHIWKETVKGTYKRNLYKRPMKYSDQWMRLWPMQQTLKLWKRLWPGTEDLWQRTYKRKYKRDKWNTLTYERVSDLSQRTNKMNLYTLTSKWDFELCNRLWNYERDSGLWQRTYKRNLYKRPMKHSDLWDTLTYERVSVLSQRTHEMNLWTRNTLTYEWDSNLCNRLWNYERDSGLWQRTYDRGPIKGTYTRDPWNTLTYERDSDLYNRIWNYKRNSQTQTFRPWKRLCDSDFSIETY